MGVFIVNLSHNLSYRNLIEYLNPALIATMANKEDNHKYARALYDPNSVVCCCNGIRNININ